MLIGEVFFRDPARVARYVRPDELHLVFNFTLQFTGWDAGEMKSAIDRTIDSMTSVGATPTWVLETHDVPRLATRYGGGEDGVRRARAAALLLLALPGTAFLYQGQELGLEDVDLPAELRQDPIFHRTNGERLGRDGCRVPVPWTGEPPAFGFTDGTPWLPMPSEFGPRSVEAEQGVAGSTLELFRTAIARRPTGPLVWRETPPGTLSFARSDLVCVVNVDGDPTPLPEGDVVVRSDDGDGALAAGAAAWIT
jgi:alpha-glucosidase